MKAVIQKVSKADVHVDNKITGVIDKGLVVLLGIGKKDSKTDADYLVRKIMNLRIFEDKNQKMNLSLSDIKGKLLVVSQFTLFADCKRGNRPSFTDAAPPEKAEELYLYFINKARDKGIIVETGKFKTTMKLSLVNEGPVTIILDTENQNTNKTNNK